MYNKDILHLLNSTEDPTQYGFRGKFLSERLQIPREYDIFARNRLLLKLKFVL